MVLGAGDKGNFNDLLELFGARVVCNAVKFQAIHCLCKNKRSKEVNKFRKQNVTN